MNKPRWEIKFLDINDGILVHPSSKQRCQANSYLQSDWCILKGHFGATVIVGDGVGTPQHCFWFFLCVAADIRVCKEHSAASMKVKTKLFHDQLKALLRLRFLFKTHSEYNKKTAQFVCNQTGCFSMLKENNLEVFLCVDHLTWCRIFALDPWRKSWSPFNLIVLRYIG